MSVHNIESNLIYTCAQVLKFAFNWNDTFKFVAGLIFREIQDSRFKKVTESNPLFSNSLSLKVLVSISAGCILLFWNNQNASCFFSFFLSFFLFFLFYANVKEKFYLTLILSNSKRFL